MNPRVNAYVRHLRSLAIWLATVIRGERFSDGEIAGAFERGILRAAARRARDLLAA